MRIETGHPVTADVKIVDAKCVRFVADDGRAIFEVRIENGNTIEIRAVDAFKHDGKVFDNKLVVLPKYANCIQVTTMEIDRKSK